MLKDPRKHKITKARQALGAKVKKQRLAVGLTKAELARMLEVKPTYIGSIEIGERNLSIESIIPIAWQLQCQPGDLMPNILL